MKFTTMFFTASAAFLRGNAKKQEALILYLPQTGWLADLPAIRQAHMQAIQPSRPQA